MAQSSNIVYLPEVEHGTIVRINPNIKAAIVAFARKKTFNLSLKRYKGKQTEDVLAKLAKEKPIICARFLLRKGNKAVFDWWDLPGKLDVIETIVHPEVVRGTVVGFQKKKKKLAVVSFDGDNLILSTEQYEGGVLPVNVRKLVSIGDTIYAKIAQKGKEYFIHSWSKENVETAADVHDEDEPAELAEIIDEWSAEEEEEATNVMKESDSLEDQLVPASPQTNHVISVQPVIAQGRIDMFLSDKAAIASFNGEKYLVSIDSYKGYGEWKPIQRIVFIGDIIYAKFYKIYEKREVFKWSTHETLLEDEPDQGKIPQ